MHENAKKGQRVISLLLHCELDAVIIIINVITKKVNMLFILKETKCVINLTTANNRLKLRRTTIKELLLQSRSDPIS